MRLQLCVFLVAALLGPLSALQSPASFSRRQFGSKLATAGAVVALVGIRPDSSAWAATTAPEAAPKTAVQKRQILRGGRKMADDTHNGTELNEKQASVASGLLGKLGEKDITPYSGGAK